MNKQQLAAKIWQSANQMRSKIEANEYKDYILGFIFYKYLSDKEIEFAKKEGYSDEDIEKFKEPNIETMSKEEYEESFENFNYISENIGYFISYENLFSTWIKKGKDFDVSNVRDALSAFNRSIHSKYKKLFAGVFETLQTGLSKLGENSTSQTKAISDLLYLIKDIPMTKKQDYDVLGFIYEYLIGMFAANAGKKAGEFYTPHEVSLLMSEIVAYHLKDREKIEIYDPTSGSGSLLINIGNSSKKYISNGNNIKYYAQELKKNTYNLTRMNLIMRGILPDNIEVRNGDTLEQDWPYFDENNPTSTYNPLYLDAVVSNPPYSQPWDPTNKENDPRYSRYGLAPKTKADYAFLLHDLYHLKPDGIMTIVLPHGVLFRGGEEGKIREKLIEYNNIDTIIGLPSNIFFGTGIPTIIMVLKQKRENTDVLFIDASKGFIKVGKNNQLRASDIKKIVDTFIERKTIPNYSKVVTKEEIKQNEYNLNIPRYINSSRDTESYDLYSCMFGAISQKELNEIGDYLQTFPNLKKDLFTQISDEYFELKTNNIREVVINHLDIKSFNEKYIQVFDKFDEFLKINILDKLTQLNISQTKDIISKEIFKRLENINLIDKYEAYQIFHDNWEIIEEDLEIIQTEGFESIKKVIPNMVIKNQNKKEVEVQDGYKGYIIPFDIVQKEYFYNELTLLEEKENKILEINSKLNEIIDLLDEEEKIVLNESNESFDKAELAKKVKEIYSSIENEEIKTLKEYVKLLDNKAKKQEKVAFISSNKNVSWDKIQANKDGTFSKTNVNKYIKEIQENTTFEKDSFEYKMVSANELFKEEKKLKEEIKDLSQKLHLKTKQKIENLSDDEIYNLLEIKWISPLISSLNKLPSKVIENFLSKIETISEKYEITYENIENEIKQTEQDLVNLLDELEADEFDKKAIEKFKSFLEGK